MTDLSKVRISDCELSVRNGNLLKGWFGNVTMDIIAAKSDDELRAIPHFTRKCLREIREVIENIGVPQAVAVTLYHREDCDWHVDQYPWECTCGEIPDPNSRRPKWLTTGPQSEIEEEKDNAFDADQ